MTANELRIGNKFYLPSGEVGTISYHEIRLMVVALDKPNYKPIPLTEEWLLKFGFEKQSRRFYVLNNWVVEYREGTKLFNFVAEEPIDIIVKYVHQLQNLYFALTGEELTFKSE